jgi:hypothetical protein
MQISNMYIYILYPGEKYPNENMYDIPNGDYYDLYLSSSEYDS